MQMRDETVKFQRFVARVFLVGVGLARDTIRYSICYSTDLQAAEKVEAAVDALSEYGPMLKGLSRRRSNCLRST